MRLGFHYHVPMFRDDEGRLRTPGYQGRFLDALARECEQLVCFLHTPRPDEMPRMDYTITAPNVHWVHAGPHVRVPERILHSTRLTRPLSAWKQRIDCLLIRGPSALLPAAASAADGLLVALLIVGDFVAGADASRHRFWKKTLIRAWCRWNYWGQMRAARRALTFVNSQQLYDAFRGAVPRLHLTRTTTLTEKDGYQREDTCVGRPVRLLYTGRMASAKGLMHMVEALAALVEAGEDVVLDLVGMPERNDPVLEEVFSVCGRHGLAGRVAYHGYRPLGPELFAFYRQADIYVLASSFEGFPRTIWEAMAHSLPVVATAVGSIPLYLQDGETARLLPPGDGKALADVIMDVIRDGGLRRRLIRAGRELARTNTLERLTTQMVSVLQAEVHRPERTGGEAR